MILQSRIRVTKVIQLLIRVILEPHVSFIKKSDILINTTLTDYLPIVL